METLILNCVICGRPIPLQSANTDGHERPVHSDCYLEKRLEGIAQDIGMMRKPPRPISNTHDQ